VCFLFEPVGLEQYSNHLGFLDSNILIIHHVQSGSSLLCRNDHEPAHPQGLFDSESTKKIA
jgi:hypothetical protein